MLCCVVMAWFAYLDARFNVKWRPNCPQQTAFQLRLCHRPGSNTSETRKRDHWMLASLPSSPSTKFGHGKAHLIIIMWYLQILDTLQFSLFILQMSFNSNLLHHHQGISTLVLWSCLQFEWNRYVLVSAAGHNRKDTWNTISFKQPVKPSVCAVNWHLLYNLMNWA